MTKRFPILLFVFLLLCGCLVLWYFSEITAYIVIAVVLAIFLNPIVDKINDIYFFGLQVPRWFGAIISFVILGIFLWLVVLLIIPLVSHQFSVLEGISVQEINQSLQKPIIKLENFLYQYHLAPQKEGFLITTLLNSLLDLFNLTNISSMMNNVVKLSGNILTALFAIPFITFFLLIERGILKNSFFSVVPNKYFEVTISVLTKLELLLAGYLRGLIIQTLLVMILSSVSLFIAGINNSIILGIVIGALNLIPYLGPLIAYFLCIFISIISEISFDTQVVYFELFMKISIVFLVIQSFDTFLLRPFIFSKSLKIHPLEIFIVIFIGAEIGGPIGMLIALPGYTVIKVSIEEFVKAYNRYRVFK